MIDELVKALYDSESLVEALGIWESDDFTDWYIAFRN